MSEEKLPISEKITVIQSSTLYKSSKWWSAVALVDSFGRKQVSVYLWLNRNGMWKRQEKLIIHNRKEWELVKATVERMIEQLS